MLGSGQKVQIIKQKGKQWPHQMLSIGKLFILNSTYQLCFLLSSCLFRMFVTLNCAKVLKPRALRCPGLMCICFLIKVWLLPIAFPLYCFNNGFPSVEKDAEQIFIWMCRWQSWTSRIRCRCTHPPACPLKTTFPLAQKTFWSSLSNGWWERHVFMHLEVSHQDPCI